MSNKSTAAAAHIWQHWQSGLALTSLPDDCRPNTLQQGYAAQACLPAACGDVVAGWKIAATSSAGQRHIGVDGPLAGRLFSERICMTPATVPLGANRMRVAEAEFAFVLADDLRPRGGEYSVDEVMARVARLHPAIELPDSRFEDFANAGAAQLLADNACAHLFVLGEAVAADWRSVDLSAHAVNVFVNGDVVVEGTGADVLGDPRAALAWIANNHALQGEHLRAGQVITTGVCGRPYPFTGGEHIVADFGAFGQVEVTIS